MLLSGAQAPIITITPEASIDENSAQGTLVASFSVTPSGGWTFSLQDDHGGQLQISGNEVQAGGVPIDYETQQNLSFTIVGMRGTTQASASSAIAINNVIEDPQNTIAPAITGTEEVGQEITCGTGTWTDMASGSYSYQWYQSPDTLLSGATSAAYTVQNSDVNFQLFCRVTATNTANSINADSELTAIIPTPASVPGDISDLVATALSSTAVSLSYTPASDATSHEARYSLTGLGSWSSWATLVSDQIGGLSPDTEYDFQVRGVNLQGNGNASNTATETTNASGTTLTFFQGELWGGGYAISIDITPDGAFKGVATDEGGAAGWVRNDVTGEWDGLYTLSSVEGFGGYGSNIGCQALVGAPSNSDVVYSVTNTSTNNILRSDDHGATLSITGSKIDGEVWSPRGLGPLIAVDPNDEDTYYVANRAGVIFVSHDGGATQSIVADLADVLPQATATADKAAGSTVITVDAVPSSFNPYRGMIKGRFCFDIDQQDAIRGQNKVITGQTSTTITLSSGISNTISTDDTIVFGAGACIAFDSTSGTDINGYTNRIVIGFGWGVDGIYESNNAGATWTNISTAGGEAGPTSACKVRISSEGVLYVCDAKDALNQWGVGADLTQGLWRYRVGDSPKWKQLSTCLDANPIVDVAMDNVDGGNIIAFKLNASGARWSINYGDNWTFFSAYPTRSADQAPYLNNSPVYHGSVVWDPVVSGRIWYTNGNGIWRIEGKQAANYPGNNTNWSYTLILDCKNNCELIAASVKKLPNGPLAVGVLDHAGFLIDDVTVCPSSDLNSKANFGYSVQYAQIFDFDYNKDNSTPVDIVCNVFTSANVSHDKGETWSRVSTWDGSGDTPAAKGWGGCVAMQTADNYTIFGPTGLGVTTDDGDTWKAPLFEGVILTAGFVGSYYWQNKIVCADLVDDATYYAICAGAVRNTYWCPPSALQIADGATGYQVGDSLVMSGGTKSAAARITVTEVDNGGAGPGVITGAEINPRYPGIYQIPPSNPISTTGGSGSGATFNVIQAYRADATWQRTDQYTLRFTEGSNGADYGTFRPGAVLHSPDLAMGNRANVNYLVSAGVWDMGDGYALDFSVHSGIEMYATWQSYSGIWRSQDSGLNYELMHYPYWLGNVANYSQCIRAVPGHEGHLFLGSGRHSRFGAYRSVDGAATWTDCIGFGALNKGGGASHWCQTLAVGPIAPGASYPSIHMIGTIPGNSQMGLYRCTDFTTDPNDEGTWELLSQTPWNLLDIVTDLTCDPNVYGRFFAATSTTGYFYAELQ